MYQTCVRKGNIWGDWERKYSFKVQTEYNKWGLVIYLYYNGNHPSNYDMKIMIDKSSQKEIDEEWVSYIVGAFSNKFNIFACNINILVCTYLRSLFQLMQSI